MYLKFIKYSYCYLFIFLFCSQCSVQTDNSKTLKAWWYEIQLQPDKVYIYKHPISKFNSKWIAGKALSIEWIKKQVSIKEIETFNKVPFTFEEKIDLNQNKVKEFIFVGIYKDKNKNTGKFLAILENDTIKKVFYIQTLSHFSALIFHDNQLKWYHCLQCNNFDTVIWNGNSYFLE